MNTEILRDRLPKKKGITLIVGSHVYHGRTDRRRAYDEAIGVDVIAGEGVDYVIDLTSDYLPPIGLFDHIECCSVLEHTPKPWLIAANLERLLVPCGTIFVAAPFVWRLHAYPDDYFRFTVSGIKCLFTKIEWTFDAITSIDCLDKSKAPIIKKDGHPYISRSESVCFGHKR